MLQKTINSFKYAIRGLKTVWTEEHNFRTEVVAAVVVVGSMFYFRFTLIECSL
jgi:diacylglycerol kinase